MIAKLFRPSGLKISLGITLLVVAIFTINSVSIKSSFLNLLDKKWVDFIVKEREVQPHTDQVVIATIDTKSVDHFGRWPWPRARMAELLEALNGYYQASIIAFDIVFSEPEHDEPLRLTDDYKNLFNDLNFGDGAKVRRFVRFLESAKAELDGDAKFGRRISDFSNVVLGYFFFTDDTSLSYLKPEEITAAARRINGSEISLLQGAIPRGIIPIGRVVEANIDKLNRPGIPAGFFNMVPDSEDGTVRRVHLLMEYGENVYPSLDLQVIRRYYGAENLRVISDPASGIQEIYLDSKVIKPNFDGSILINYKGPTGTFPHYSVYDIIQHTIPKEKLQDKIVLVGATEVGIFDLRNTPVAVDYPGVEVHATLLDNIITDSYFQLDLLNDVYTFLVILALGLVLGLTLPHLKSAYGTIVTVVILVAYALAHRWMVMNLLTWTSFIYPALTIVLIWAAVTLFRFLVTDKDKRFIKGAFQQYLSPQVITQLMDNPQLLQLGGERRVLTAFFSDVQGFSTISEKLDPTELVKLLNIYLTEMTNILTDVEGTVDKYEGDAIIAFFGAPVPYEDHAQRACLASLEMQRRLAEMREQWKAEGTPPLFMRIGLNTGPMVVGNMGSEKRFDYTMMGNSVNLAARLEGANKNYGTYTCMSEMTYEPAKDVVEVRELDLIRVIGISQPVRLYELVARKGELSEEQKKGFAYFAKGLELYRAQEWEEAAKYFNAVNKFIPDDPPSAKFIARCREFKANPPGAEWDGVFEATSK